MSIDKSIDYVEQDGVLNYIKNSKSVTVPKEFKARKNAPATKLAYITADEAKMLKKMKKGTPHKGPKGIPSYDSFDAQGNFRSGAEMSAAERGDKGPFGRAPGAMRAAQDIRSSAIAAGAGQRVNPGFFDSRNTVSRSELARARALDPTAFRKGRSSGIGSFISGGGFFGNLIRSLGRRIGFGKDFNEPTYDMSQFNNLGLLTNRVNPEFDDGSNEDLLSLVNTSGIKSIDLGNPTGDPRVVPEEQGLGRVKDYLEDDGIISFLPNNFASDINPAFRNMIMPVGMNETQKKMIDSAAGAYGKVNPGEKLNQTAQKEIFDNIKKFDTKAKEGLFGTSVGAKEADPLTEQEYKNYLISQGYI